MILVFGLTILAPWSTEACLGRGGGSTTTTTPPPVTTASTEPPAVSDDDDVDEGEVDEPSLPVTHATLKGLMFSLTWVDGTVMEIAMDDEGDCIYEGVMPDDAASTVLVTGCAEEGDDLGVQIQSAVHGDMMFNSVDGEAVAIVFDPFDYDEE